MNIKDILAWPEITKIHTALCKDAKDREADDWEKQYSGDHDILRREDKTIGSGKTLKTVKTAKEVVTFQKKIVHYAVSFLFGNPVRLSVRGEEKDKFKEAFQTLLDVWEGSKLDSFTKRLARRLFIETKVAELWYLAPKDEKVKDSKNKLRVRLLCKDSGDEIYPHYDDYGDMDAFIRKYETKDKENKTIQHVDVYTVENTIHYSKLSGGEWDEKKVANLWGKIPVIYYDIDNPEWLDVQIIIDRYEMLISRFADTNDYFGSPAVEQKGDIESPPTKEEVGRVYRIDGERNETTGVTEFPGGVKYITWDRAPESIKLELETLKDIIYSLTDTPDLSFQNVKGTRSLSGQALEFMFLGSLLKSKDHEEVFGEGMSRRVNLLKAGISVAMSKYKALLEEMKVKVEFSSILPQNVKELIESLSVARGGEPTMSTESAVKKNPLVENPVDDIRLLEEEDIKRSSLGGSFGIEE